MPRQRHRAVKWTARALVGFLMVALAAFIATLLVLRASLPRTAGVAEVTGLTAPVEIARDAGGVPIIRGASYEDVTRGLGFVVAQERFFQMDLARRLTAGELAALAGPGALALDREARVLQYRVHARRIAGELPEPHRALIEAYTVGVNAGLADLRARPPEYVLLRARPEPWQPEDTILVLLAFFRGLSNNQIFEEPLGVLRATLPPELFDFLTPDTTRFDTPVMPDDLAHQSTGYSPMPIPGPEIINLRHAVPRLPDRPLVHAYGDLPVGSNNWAVAASRSAHGGAILANDPHLQLMVPNIWFRAELVWDGNSLRGVTAPGLPGIVLGSTDYVAWGATNSFADQTDLIVVEAEPADPTRYLTPDGNEPFRIVHEQIEVRGREPEPLEIRLTRWGPVVGNDWLRRPLALRSTAFDPRGINLNLLDMKDARHVADAARIARQWHGPAQNLVFVDREGNIGWAVSGALPRRIGFDGKVPLSWHDGSVYWDGVQDSSSQAAIVAPDGGVLFSANHRTIGDLAGSRAVSRVWLQPTRAHRLAELLAAGELFTEHDFLEMQLDTRSIEHDTVRDLVLEIVQGEDDEPILARVREHVVAWNGRADADQPAFRLLQVYSEALRERILGPLLQPAVEAAPGFTFNWPLVFEPTMRILEERPMHLLPLPYQAWPSFLRDVLVEAMHDLERGGDAGLDASWGEVNRAGIRHPLTLAAPALSRLLDMPDDPLPGWPGVLRTQAPGYGASMRMVASPGRLDTALFQMPGGQSGHFLSPHYASDHDAWVHGRPMPLQPGAPTETFMLVPVRE